MGSNTFCSNIEIDIYCTSFLRGINPILTRFFLPRSYRQDFIAEILSTRFFFPRFRCRYFVDKILSMRLCCRNFVTDILTLRFCTQYISGMCSIRYPGPMKFSVLFSHSFLPVLALESMEKTWKISVDSQDMILNIGLL